MFGLGMQELIIILLIVVVVFGSTRLPQVGEGLGKMITNFRKSMKNIEKEDKEEENESSQKKEIHGP